MLLGTHPIPARSPAEREGRNGKMRTEGGRQKRRRRRRGGECVGGEWGSVDGGMIGGGDREKLGIVFFWFFLKMGLLRMMVIHQEGKREKMEGLLVM